MDGDQKPDQHGNLVVTLRIGERIRITAPDGKTITVTPTGTRGEEIVKVSVRAPQSYRIARPDAGSQRAAECVGRRIQT